MDIPELFANLSYSVIDLIASGMLLTSIVLLRNDKPKFTFDYLHGLSKYIKTWQYVLIVIILGVSYFFISNFVQNNVTSYFSSLGLKTIPLFVLTLSIAVFWITKVGLGRRWRFNLVWGSIVVGIISFALLFL